MIAFVALRAGEATGDALHEGILVNLKFDDMIKGPSALGQQRIERGGLRSRAGIAVEDHALLGVRLIETFADDATDDFVGHELTRFHHRLGLQADRRSGLHRRAKHVARGKLDHAAIMLEA